MNRTMLKKRLSIGHNGTEDFVEVMERYKESIYEVYFAPPSWVIPSTRPCSATELPEYSDCIKRHIARSRSREWDIRFSIVLNSECWGGDFRSAALVQRIVDFCRLLDFDFDNIVVSDTFLASVLAPMLPQHVSFTTSVVSKISSAEEALEYCRAFPGFDCICVGHRLHYDLAEMERIKRVTGKKIKVLLNQGCYFHCIDYQNHSTALAHIGHCHPPLPEGKALYCDRINGEWSGEDGWKNLLHQAIPPSAVAHYAKVVDVFKLSTRTQPNNEVVSEIVGDYITGNDRTFVKRLFAGGARSVGYEVAAVFSMVKYPDDHYRIRTSCKTRCATCQHCRTLWNEARDEFLNTPPERRPAPKTLYLDLPSRAKDRVL